MGKRTIVGRFLKVSWHNLQIRCGKHRHHRNKSKCKVYDSIKILFTREEYKKWCWSQKELIESLERPSLDRVDSSGHYCLENIQIIELRDNIAKKRPGNRYINGHLSNTRRGVRSNSSGFVARLHVSGVEVHLGQFKNKEDAYACFYDTYLEFYGKTPW